MTIHVVGNGKPVLFIHGYLESKTMWSPLELEKAPWKSIIIDLPGHGDSFYQEFEDFEQLALYINDEIKKQQLEYDDIVGHSLGGYIAIEIHKKQTKKGNLILFHSNFWDDSPEKKNDRNRVIEIVQTNKSMFIKEAIPNLFLEHKRNDPFVINLVQEALLISSESISLYARLMRDRKDESIYVNEQREHIYFVYGEHDHLLSQQLLTKYKVGDLQNFKYNSGHMGHFENSEKAKEILEKIIN
jgi:surfactin synthase thioesterase subunit